MSKRYLVHVPNPQFSENVMGVQFNKGKGTVDENSIDESLGYNVDEIARHMKVDLGYEVEEIGTSDKHAEEPVVKTSKRT